MDADRRESIRATANREYITYPTETTRMEIDSGRVRLGSVSGSRRMIEYREPEQTVSKRVTKYIWEG